MSGEHAVTVQLTQRALSDLGEILEYSTEQWGEERAQAYLDSLQAGLDALRTGPEALASHAAFPPTLRFRRVNKHLLICDAQPGSIIVLTVVHASRDIPSLLSQLQPTLAGEVDVLHRQARKALGAN